MQCGILACTKLSYRCETPKKNTPLNTFLVFVCRDLLGQCMLRMAFRHLKAKRPELHGGLHQGVEGTIKTRG